MLYKSSGYLLNIQNMMSMILWTSFFISIVCRKCSQGFCLCMCVCVYDTLKPANILSHLWEQGNRLIYLSSQSLPAGWIHGSLSLSCFLSSLGRWFTFWFPTSHLVPTECAKEDEGFSLLSRPTTGFGHDGGFDQVLWVGHGTGSSHWMSGMFCSKCWDILTKGRHSPTKVGGTVAKLGNWSVGKEFNSGQSDLNQSAHMCYGIPSSTSAFLGILGCVSWGPECWNWPTSWKKQELRNQSILGRRKC